MIYPSSDSSSGNFPVRHPSHTLTRSAFQTQLLTWTNYCCMVRTMQTKLSNKTYILKRNFYVTVALSLLASLSLCRSQTDTDSSLYLSGDSGLTLARQAFDSVNSRYDKLVSLQYNVQRTTTTKGTTLNEQWFFAFMADGRMYIDYQKPEKRIFVYDGERFTEYLPTVRKALQTIVSEDDPQALARIQMVLQRLSIDGLQIGNREMLLAHFLSARWQGNQSSKLKIRGQKPNYEILIDTQRQVLLEFEKYDFNGDLVLSIQTSDFCEPIPGFWFPSTVHTTVVDTNGKRETRASISAIRLNHPIGKKTFDITFPPDVKIKTVNGSQ